MTREATREATPVVTNAAASSEAEASAGADDSTRTTQQESSGGTRHMDQRGSKKRPIFTALVVGCIMVAIATACVAAFAHKSADIPKASLTSESTTEAPSPDITLEATLSPTPTPSPSPKRDRLSGTSTDTSASEATTPCPAEDPSGDTGDASSFASSSDSDSPWVQRGQQASDSSAGLIESEEAPTNETDTTTPNSSTPSNTSSLPTSVPALTTTSIPSDNQTSEPPALEPSSSPETSKGTAPTSSEPTTEPTPNPSEESSSSTESEVGSSSTSSSIETVEAIPTPSTSLSAGSSSGSTPSLNEESSTATAPVSGSGSDSSSVPPSTSTLLTVSTSANASNFVLLKNIAVGADGAVYLSDEHRILRYIEGNNAPSVYSGSLAKGFFGGNFADAQYDTPKGLVFDSNNNLYVSDSQNFLVRILDASTGTVRDFAGSRPGASGDGFNQETKLIFKALDFAAADRANNLYLPDTDVIWKVDPAGKIGILASFPGARGIAIDSQQGFAYVTSANAIHRVSADGLTVTTIAGDSTNGYMDGSGEGARFYNPLGLAFDQDGNLLVADSGNHCIRKIALDDNNEVTTLAGQCTQAGDAEGPANGGALFTLPSALARHSQSGAVYVVDGIPPATRMRKIL